MSLLSSFRKNKQETAAEDSTFYSRAESDSQAVRPRKRKTAGRATDAESNAPVDPVLPEKKRARRRLVGAVALVLAVVIGLPMLLDSEPKPLADDISIEIPSKDKPAPARPLSDAPAGSATPGNSRVPAGAALDQQEEVIDPAMVAAVAPGKNAHHASASTESATEARALLVKAGDKAESKGNPVPDKAARKPGDKAPEKTSEKLAGKAVDKAGDTARADSADARHGKFSVQVAAFTSIEKVNELRGRLKTAGIASYTQKVATGGGERIRIRVGPLNSRQDADRMRARLNELGLNGTLVPLSS